MSGGNLFGGIETIQVTLARCRELCPAMDSHFAVCFEGRFSQALRQHGATVHHLDKVRARRPLSVLRARRALASLLRRERFDLVVCHAEWPLAIFGPSIRASGIPLVVWIHHPPDHRHWLSRWARLVPPDAALCNSHFTAGVFGRANRAVPHHTVYCPVVTADFGPDSADRAAVRAEFDTPVESTVIVQVSRMEAIKGHALHIDALAAMKDVPGWICWFVGGAQRPAEVAYQASLRERCRDLGIESRVRFLGERDDVARLLSASDVYCQPNTGPEGFGISFVEAMASRLPVLTTAIGGALEIVDETCGVLVKADDVGNVAFGLRRLVSDEPLRRRLGDAGPGRAGRLCEPSKRLSQLYGVLRQATVAGLCAMTAAM